jgi:hypothetical protein
MKGVRLIPLCVLVVGLVYAGTLASRDIDPRLGQRPAVAKPACTEPKPYRVEGWNPDVVGFRVGLTTARADGELEAKRLASKYKFEIYNNYGSAEGFALSVVWLDPEQVAALRCEKSVDSIGFILRLIPL